MPTLCIHKITIKDSPAFKDITIYPISDVHLGALEHNSEEWNSFIEKIKSMSPNRRIRIYK